MPYSRVYTKIEKVENLNIWRQNNETTQEWEIKVNLNVTLGNEEGYTQGFTKLCILTSQQADLVLGFVKAKVNELGQELDVEIPPWAQS